MRAKIFWFLLACFVSNSYAQDSLKPQLGPSENPIYSPDQVQNTPYVKLFLEMNVLPMLVWNSEGGLIAANDAYISMLGYTRDEMRSKKLDWVSVTPEEYRKLDEHCINELKTKEFCTPYVKEYIKKNGKRIAVKLWNAQAKMKDGQNIAIILPMKLMLPLRKKSHDETG